MKSAGNWELSVNSAYDPRWCNGSTVDSGSISRGSNPRWGTCRSHDSVRSCGFLLVSTARIVVPVLSTFVARLSGFRAAKKGNPLHRELDHLADFLFECCEFLTIPFKSFHVISLSILRTPENGDLVETFQDRSSLGSPSKKDFLEILSLWGRKRSERWGGWRSLRVSQLCPWAVSPTHRVGSHCPCSSQ